MEERVQILEKSIPLLSEQIANTQRELDAVIVRLRQQLRQVTANTDHMAHQLSTRLTEFGTGGLHISAIGALWLLVGSVLGTASHEILRLVQ